MMDPRDTFWMTIQNEIVTPICRSVLHRRYDPDARARDILSTLFERSRGRTTERAWVVVTTYGEAQKTFRFPKNRPAPLETVSHSHNSSCFANLLDELCSNETIAAVNRALDELTEEERLALFARPERRRRSRQMTLDEKTALKCTQGRIRRLRREARAKLLPRISSLLNT